MTPMSSYENKYDNKNISFQVIAVISRQMIWSKVKQRNKEIKQKCSPLYSKASTKPISLLIAQRGDVGALGLGKLNILRQSL